VSEYLIDEETAHKVLAEMVAAYGPPGIEQDEDVIIGAIRRGFLEFDGDAEEVVYRLQAPQGELKTIRMGEPDAGQMQRILRGVEALTDATGKSRIDLSIMETQAIRSISILGGVNVAAVEKLKRRDYKILREVTRFFG
jgi:hypothetical protein